MLFQYFVFMHKNLSQHFWGCMKSFNCVVVFTLQKSQNSFVSHDIQEIKKKTEYE